jgi:hypothetical protein
MIGMGIETFALTGEVKAADQSRIYDDLLSTDGPNVKLLYVTPEKVKK